MIKLTGLRIINWHAFADETIEIKNSVLISGENGAGKSTILDAIQFVLTCSEKNFNKAANEKSKRQLVGYVRYKTGKEERDYERVGNIVSHIALEFYEEEKKKKFVIGTVIDSSSDSSVDFKFYRIENISLERIEFRDKSIEEFKRYANQFKVIMFKSSDARKDFRNRLGNLNEKFFEILPKALAFKPIENVKDFVYSYVLEEKNINIDALRENIRSYKDFEYMLDDIKCRIKNLEEICNYYHRWEKKKEASELHNYLVIKAEEVSLSENVDLLLKNIKSFELSCDSKLKEVKELEVNIHGKVLYKNKIERQIETNEEYKLIEDLKNLLSSKLVEFQRVREEKELVCKKIEIQKDCLKNLYKHKAIGIYKEVYENVTNINLSDLDNLKLNLIEKNDLFKEIKEDVHKEIIKLGIEIEKLFDELKNIEKTVVELRKRNLQYPDEVRRLQSLIREEGEKLGRKVNPQILCDLLDITDRSWQNAVEGYLNTQKFYLLVEDVNFDFAIQVYDKFKKSKKLYGCGIINTEKLRNISEPNEKSLAKIIIAKNEVAQKFINSILGNVIRCDDILELKNFKVAITKECMVHKNNVIKVIAPKIFENPFIGKNAWEVQLRRKEEEFNKVKNIFNEKKVEDNNINKYRKILELINLTDIVERLDTLKNYYNLEKEVEKIKNEIKENEDKSSYIDLIKRKETIENDIQNIEFKKFNILNEIKDIEVELRITERDKIKEEELLRGKIEEVKELHEQNILLGEKGEIKFREEKKSKSAEVIKSNFLKRKARDFNEQNMIEEELKEKQVEYNNKYEFGANIGIVGINLFARELENFKKSKIVEYEEKVKIAKKNAEEEFKEHFIAKLKEQIECAKMEFKILNRGLKGIIFGEEEYEFKIEKNSNLNKYHDMIMDNENLIEGYNLFTDSFQIKHKEALEELFEKLTFDHEDANSEKYLKEFTDYRSYMDYDILLKYKDGSRAKFSKISSEKSGGETQTPYYVIIASSFLQLYRGTYIKRKSMELIMFDEAFDKMDEERIVAMMRFYQNLGLQLIIATPPSKIDTIAPYVSTTLLAMKIAKNSIIEEYVNERL